MGIQGVHVALSVSDISVSGPWYEKVFEAQKLMEVTDDVGPIAIFINADGQIIGIRQHGGTAPGDRFDHLRIGLDHAGFNVSDLGEVEKWKARLDELGIENSGVQEDQVGYHLNFRDPDNIALEIFAAKTA